MSLFYARPAVCCNASDLYMYYSNHFKQDNHSLHVLFSVKGFNINRLVRQELMLFTIDKPLQNKYLLSLFLADVTIYHKNMVGGGEAK